MAADRMAAARLALGATDETAPAIEAHTRDLLDALCAHFQRSPYLLGNRMSMADCALMAPIYGHFFNDIVSRRLLLETAAPVVGWIERCNYPGAATQGEWETGDDLTPTLRAVLASMGRDAAPVILDTVRHVEAWADGQDSSGESIEPPRAVGRCRSELRGIAFERMAQPYCLWMIERCLGEYRRLEPGSRSLVDTALAGTGWEALLEYRPRHHAHKHGFALRID
ncbi:MAG: glutathione S-transferase domain-containing protein [Deltaproteobacteria bacterium]|nr:MAG: glutathione S-transferase domain-containing protein [Deltaproteobacteria bacterium]